MPQSPQWSSAPPSIALYHFPATPPPPLSECHGQLEASLKRLARLAMDKGRLADGATPLMLACDAGDTEAAQLLLGAGADPWARDTPHIRTCLHYAVAKGHALTLQEVLRLSLQASATVHPRCGACPVCEAGNCK